MIRSSRVDLAHAMLALLGVAILVKAAKVQLVDGKTWRARAERQQSSARRVPAERGEILDATGRVLAESRDMVGLEVAPREVNDPAALRRGLTKLAVAPAEIARALDTTGRYLTIPGRFLAVDAAAVTSLHGVHSFASMSRAYAAPPGAQGIIGHVSADNVPLDGLELALDSILRGKPGTTTMVKDSRGQLRESPVDRGSAPKRGSSVVLTINEDLQEIAEKALADAVARMGADGGDIVILDPHTGEIRAMASRRLDPRETSATVLTEPFEPGSTAKPFMAAALLERGKVSDADSVDTGDGVFVVNGRTIHDDHKIGRASLADVLRWSSNIGIVKFSERLSPDEEFETLRDFGFGTPTGLPYPTESGGTLRPPASWSKQSANSMAMGYEIAVTPLQLAAAYAAFANGGALIEPAIVKEVDAPDGTVEYRHTPRVVRQVMPREVADKIRHMLFDVVDEGTAVQASVDDYLLAGKTGTPRATVHGRYVEGRYNPNFVGIFPGDNPQYVIVVKISAPRTSIYAASTAAPVTKAILQAAIAARDAALNRDELASSELPARRDRSDSTSRNPAGQAAREAARVAANAAAVDAGADDDSSSGETRFVVTLPMAPAPPAPRVEHRVPSVRGLDLREAVRSLHSAGFHVELVASAHGGTAGDTSPAAGSLALPGTLVRLTYDY
jgi:cell division protein FtsI (penicillin-binding protein 3)